MRALRPSGINDLKRFDAYILFRESRLVGREGEVGEKPQIEISAIEITNGIQIAVDTQVNTKRGPGHGKEDGEGG